MDSEVEYMYRVHLDMHRRIAHVDLAVTARGTNKSAAPELSLPGLDEVVDGCVQLFLGG